MTQPALPDEVKGIKLKVFYSGKWDEEKVIVEIVTALSQDRYCHIGISPLSAPPSPQEGMALEKAVEVIKGWHKMASYPKRLTKELEDLAWGIYYNHSPEMKPIREALAAITIKQ